MNRTSIILPSMPAVRLMAVLLLLTLLGGGCQFPEQMFAKGRASARERDPFNTARISGFLTLKDDKGPAMRLEIESIDMISEGQVLTLNNGPLKIDSAALGTGQLYLGGLPVQPGPYQLLRLTIIKAEVQKPDGTYAEIENGPWVVENNLPEVLNLQEGDSKSLLFTWDVHGSMAPDNTFDPAITIFTPLKELPVDLVFVSCPDINTVFIIRADKNWVVDSFGLQGSPTYMAIDPDVSRQRLYVLSMLERSVKVIDLTSYQVVDTFPMTFNDKPTFLAVSPDSEWAYLLDENSGYLSRMNLANGMIENRVLVGYKPNYLAYLGEKNLLAVSMSLSQQVLLLDPLRLSILASFPTGEEPQGAIVVDNQLYVAEETDNTVLITDLDNTAMQSRLAVGFGPRRLLEAGGWIYVSNYDSGSLSVLFPGQGVVVREISGLGRPQEMAEDQFNRRLYVADEDSTGLTVIDTNTNEIVGKIILGAGTLGLQVIQ